MSTTPSATSCAMQHRGTDPAHPGWTRTYAYNEASLIESELGKVSNRLSSTQIGNGPASNPTPTTPTAA